MFGEWLSLVEHLVRDQGVGGSNPLSPTIFISQIVNEEAAKAAFFIGDNPFRNDRPGTGFCWPAGVDSAMTGTLCFFQKKQ